MLLSIVNHEEHHININSISFIPLGVNLPNQFVKTVYTVPYNRIVGKRYRVKELPFKMSGRETPVQLLVNGDLLRSSAANDVINGIQSMSFHGKLSMLRTKGSKAETAVTTKC